VDRIRQLIMERRMSKINKIPHQHRPGVFQFTRWRFDVANMEQTNLQTGRKRNIRVRDTLAQLCTELRKHIESDIPETEVRTKAIEFAKRKFDDFVNRNSEKIVNAETLTQMAKEYTNNQLAKRVRTLYTQRSPALGQTRHDATDSR
jgi:hypothetical protein